MRFVICLFALLLPWVAPVRAESRPQPDRAEYWIEIPKKVVSFVRDKGGKNVLYLSLQFQIQRMSDRANITSIPKEEIRITEDGKDVLNLELFQPNAQPLTVILAMDISGSMERGGKIDKAKAAALSFLDRLDQRSDVGLILFDHEIRVAEKAVGDPAKQKDHRKRLREIILNAKPTGGTAYLDATVKAVEMLRGVPGRRAAVIMTDGSDTNSQVSLKDAIQRGLQAEVPIYTVGIGNPGKNETVTSVLVLDRSGSMTGKADDTDALTKMDALKRAAQRFIELMRPGATTTVLPFSSTVGEVGQLTSDKEELKKRIVALEPMGGTLLYDATYYGIETLQASGEGGRRAVVVLTDGKDESPGSRHSDDLVIERAKQLKIPLYMLGLGRPGEINEPVMQKMAEATGGKYYNAGNQKRLLEVFENLSIELHDDGIDEKSLTELAEKTGGKYRHVSKLSELQFIYEQLADELQSTYKATFESRRSSHDGTARGIDVQIIRDGEVKSTGGRIDTVVRGVAVPQMSYLVYLLFLVVLGGLLALPGLFKQTGQTT